MKRIILAATTCVIFALPVQSASAAEYICQSGNFVTQKCLTHMQKMADIGDDLSLCFTNLNKEYQGMTGNGAGKGRNYIARQNECMRITQKAMDALTDAYVPGGDTSMRRQLRQGLKDMTEARDAAEAELAKTSN